MLECKDMPQNEDQPTVFVAPEQRGRTMRNAWRALGRGPGHSELSDLADRRRFDPRPVPARQRHGDPARPA